MKKNIILKFATLVSLFWLCLPFKLRKFIFTSLFIIESRGMYPEKGLTSLFLIKDKLDWIINERALKYGNGIHPKHSLTKYHQFFIDRIKNGENVLDVGCGNGSVAISIAKKLPNSFITGIDINKKSIEFAKDKQTNTNLKNLKFINGNIDDFPKIASDVVVLSNVLEHIENRILFLKKIQKISGAKTFLIRVPYFKRDWEVAFRRKLNMYYFSDNDHKIEHTIEELKKELSKANLVMRETKTVWGEIWTKCEYDL